MSRLLDEILTAHGDLERWRAVTTLTVTEPGLSLIGMMGSCPTKKRASARILGPGFG
jgi:hypothetical protein